VTREQSQLEGAALVAVRAEFDQVHADAHFTSYDALLSFTSTEYLRDKKNTLYALLFTQDLGEELNAKTLRLLNESGFSEVTFSERAIPIFSEIARPQRVSSVVQLAYNLGLKNVQDCLSNELPTLTFDSMREMIDEAQRADLARELPSVFEETLGLLGNCVSAVKVVPEFAHRSIMAFCDYAERNVASLSAKGIGALMYLLNMFQRSSPMVNYAQAIASSEPTLISETFTAALFRSEARAVTELSSRLSELSFARDEELAATGRRFLELGIRWEVYPFRPFLAFLRVATEPDETTRELVRSIAREVYVRHRHQTKFNRTHSNFQFSIDFVLPEKLFSQESDWYAENLSFWLAFYADSGLVTDRLYPFPPRPRWFFEHLFYETVSHLDAELTDRALFVAYNASNFFCLMLMDPETFYNPRQLVQRLLEQLYVLPRNIRPSQPFDILLSNLLAWALQTRQDEVVNQILAYIRDLRNEKLTLSPFIRIIL
jgi:hypothetical protein